MSYQVSFCFWLLSFEQDIAEQINKLVFFYPFIFRCPSLTTYFTTRKYDVIPLLISVAQTAVKEKVIRVVVATFRVSSPYQSLMLRLIMLSLHQNLITKAPSANLPAMLVAHLLPFAKNLSTRKFSDEDVLEDVHFVRDELTTNFQSLTCVHSFGLSSPLLIQSFLGRTMNIAPS